MVRASPAPWPAGSTISAANSACAAWSPTRPARPGSSSISNARPTRTTPCASRNYACSAVQSTLLIEAHGFIVAQAHLPQQTARRYDHVAACMGENAGGAGKKQILRVIFIVGENGSEPASGPSSARSLTPKKSAVYLCSYAADSNEVIEKPVPRGLRQGARSLVTLATSLATPIEERR
jgi:hypothetical protein